MRRYAAIAFTCVASLLIHIAGSASADPPASLVNLQINIGELRAQGMPFSDIIDDLRDKSGRNIFVNWRALKPFRVTHDLPITVDLSGLPLGKALDRLLEHVGGPYVRLAYTVDEDTIIIATSADLQGNSLTRVYDVRSAIHGEATRAKDVEAIIRRVRGIDPLSWKDAGGDIGAVRELGGQLIVTQTVMNHRLIVEELQGVLPADNAAEKPDKPKP